MWSSRISCIAGESMNWHRKSVWHYLIKLNIYIFCGPLFLVLGIYCKETFENFVQETFIGIFLVCHHNKDLEITLMPIYRRMGIIVAVIQSLSCVWLFVTLWAVAHQAPLSSTVSLSLLLFMSIESVITNHLILCHPLFLLPSIFPSIRVFSSESVLRIRWPKYWSFSVSISPSSEYLGLISSRIDWFDRDSQESSPTPQFKSVNSLVLSFMYVPTVTSVLEKS